MRIIIFFDLPVLSVKERRSYRVFRKFLIKNGFIMMQESVYSKLSLNAIAAATIIDNVKKNKPPSGLVQLFMITEKQYSSMEYIVGEHKTDTIDSDKRLIVL